METNPKEIKKKAYTCPMHPEIQQELPGMCPECGMNLVPADAHDENHEHQHHSAKNVGDHDKHEGHSTQMFLQKFWVSLVLTIPVLAYSALPELFLGWQAPRFPGSQYLQLVFGSIIFFYGGWIFLKGAWSELQAKLPGMMTLISLATTAAYLWSVFAVFFNEEPLFWELATLITIMLLGHWLEMRAVKGARGALQELAKLLPDEAEVVRGNATEIVSLDNLVVGDIVLIKPGAKIPADGIVQAGQSDVNESIVTGESKLVQKKPSDEVIAGTINGDGSLQVKVAKIGEETFLAGVMRLVAEAQASKSRLQILSDKAALYLTIIAVVAGSITLGAWLATGAAIAFAVARLVAVLVITCPHALGLAVPLVASISTNMAARNGFFVKQRLALEAARNIDIVLFDKTGTLTKGEFAVANVSDDETLQLAASLETQSEHPIAKAIVQKAKEKKLSLSPVEQFERIPGKGIQGKIQGREIQVLQAAEEQGAYTTVELFENGKRKGSIALADMVREASKEAVHMLHEQGVKVAMITGDAEEVASAVARELGIDEYFARVLPSQKADRVKALQEKGMKVAMVGDGVNDAPALTQADLGIAVGAGTNVAIESAGIILVQSNPRDIPKIIHLSKLTFRKMMQNLFWATGYNLVALPLAAGALYFKGIVLEPAVAAIFMSASTVIVAANALLLRRTKL